MVGIFIFYGNNELAEGRGDAEEDAVALGVAVGRGVAEGEADAVGEGSGIGLADPVATVIEFILSKVFLSKFGSTGSRYFLASGFGTLADC